MHSVRWCYETSVDDPCTPTNCTATVIDRTNQSIEYDPEIFNSSLEAKIWSPGKLRERNYQNNRICRYNAACPPGFLLQYRWIDRNFILEDEHVFEGCLDHILIENFDQPNFMLCGTQPEFSTERSVPLRVEFQSNTGNRFAGFQIDINCVSPEFQDSPGCTGPSTGKRKRQVYNYVVVKID